MAEDTWYSRAVPILEAVAEVDGSYLVQIGDLADRAGLDPVAVVIELERLIEAGYVSGKLTKLMTGNDVRPWHLDNVHLAPEGARIVGMWPSRDPYEALVAILERRIDEAPDEPTKSKFRQILDTVTGLGRDVGTNVVANVLVEVGRRGL